MDGKSNGRPLLEVQDIYSGYQADFDILKGVSLHVEPGEIVCVIGPNGAGKSTVFKALYGFLNVRRGRVLFDDRDITNIRPQDTLKIGITIVPQLRSLFPQMTVYENLEMGMYLERDKERIKQRIDYILELFPRLA
ncbi:MAG: ATP-binding cassette domain-containing protein, partial [Anaerolineaceae bacterium]